MFRQGQDIAICKGRKCHSCQHPGVPAPTGSRFSQKQHLLIPSSQLHLMLQQWQHMCWDLSTWPTPKPAAPCGSQAKMQLQGQTMTGAAWLVPWQCGDLLLEAAQRGASGHSGPPQCKAGVEIPPMVTPESFQPAGEGRFLQESSVDKSEEENEGLKTGAGVGARAKAQ